MALSTFATVVLGVAGVVAFFFIVWIGGRLLGYDVFGILGSWGKTKRDEIVKTKNVPDDEPYRVVNEKQGFNELVLGYEESGKDERTGITMIRFIYGEDRRLTDWEVPLDREYFQASRRNLAGKKPATYYIIDKNSAVAKLKSEVTRLDVHNKGLQNKVDRLYGDEKLRMQGDAEYQRDARRIATGWSSGGAYNNPTDLRFRPRYGWGGGAQPEEGGGEG